MQNSVTRCTLTNGDKAALGGLYSNDSGGPIVLLANGDRVRLRPAEVASCIGELSRMAPALLDAEPEQHRIVGSIIAEHARAEDVKLGLRPDIEPAHFTAQWWQLFVGLHFMAALALGIAKNEGDAFFDALLFPPLLALLLAAIVSSAGRDAEFAFLCVGVGLGWVCVLAGARVLSRFIHQQ